MKLTLISPTDRRWSYNLVDFFSSMPISLPLLASLSPDDVEVTFVDEARQELDPEMETDLVGITVMGKVMGAELAAPTDNPNQDHPVSHAHTQDIRGDRDLA